MVERSRMADQKSLIRYLTHPEVVIDPSIPVPQWRLSPMGRARAEHAASLGWLRGTTQIISSAERKAIETAEIISARTGIDVEIREATHENDRSATGVLSQTEFQAVADQFFAHPMMSVRGWERAVDAQARIVREVELVLERDQPGDILFVGHGGVGTLLFCHYRRVEIDRKYDQFGNGGCYFTMVKDTREILHGWRSIETLE
jgi:broad specificity phosphatase PhoE